MAVASLLGRATGGVTLDEEYFALLRVLVRTVGQLAGQSAARHRVLALHALAGLAGCDAGRSGQHHLFAYQLGLLRVLLQVVGQCFAYSLLYGAGHFRVAQLRLGLSLELRLGHLDADDSGQALAEVLTGYLYLGLFYLLRDVGVGIGVFLQRAGQRHAEAYQVGTALDGVDIVDVGVDILRIVRIVHHGHLDGYALLLGLQVDDIVEQVGAVTVHVAHKLLQALLGMEHLFLQVALLVGAHVLQRDGAGVQIGQFAHTLGYDVVLVFRGCEDGAVGPELLARSRQLRVADYLHVVQRLALLVLLLVDVAVAEHLRQHVCRQGVHARHAHAVQTAGNLVGTLVELTAGVEHGHDNFQGRLVHLLVLVDGNATAVVLNGDTVIFVDGYFNVGAVAGHGLVDGVVDGLIDQVVETLLADVSDIHGRALAHGLQSLEHLDVTRGIVTCVVQFFCHCFVCSQN